MIAPACTSKDDVELLITSAATDVCARGIVGRWHTAAEKGHSCGGAIRHYWKDGDGCVRSSCHVMTSLGQPSNPFREGFDHVHSATDLS